MNLKDMVDALAERILPSGGPVKNLNDEISLLAQLAEMADEQKQKALNAVYQREGHEGELLVTIRQGSFEYQISAPRYEEVEFIKNRRRGPGGKYYPYIEIEFPCRVIIIALKQNESHETEGKVNLYNNECIVEDTVLSIPEDVVTMITWHCKEYSFLLE